LIIKLIVGTMIEGALPCALAISGDADAKRIIHMSGDNHAPERLRRLIAAEATLVFPTCFDALSGRLLEQAGFQCTLMSGFGVAATRYGLPDVGLVTFTDMVDQLRNICAAAPNLCVIADGDTGYGNAMNVRRTTLEYARAGAAAIMLEDQVSPKRCGHMAGAREVVPREEAVAKIRAAVDARTQRDILVMARTDARGGLGFEEAMLRCRLFEDAGADIIFMEAPETAEELRAFAAGTRKAPFCNIAPKTPVLDRAALVAMGFKLICYNTVLPAAVHAMQKALLAVRDDDPAGAPPQAEFNAITQIVGIGEYNEIQQRYGTV
jgi:2-methylisocitrate lyase-like PEP mutase family enzyme